MQKIFLSAVLAVTVWGLPVFTFAEASMQTQQMHIGNDTYIAGGAVYAGDVVSGDLVVAGGSVTAEGSVSEDALIAGGNVDLASSVGGDVRVAGGNVSLSGSVGDSVLAATGQMTIRGAGVGGDVVWTGGNLSINAPVSGNIRAEGESLFINAPVSGNIDFSGESLTLGKNAVVSGSIQYESPKKMETQSGATVLGVVNYDEKKVSVEKKRFLMSAVSGSLVSFFMGLAGALVVGLLFQRFWEETAGRICQRRLFHFGLGFLTLIASPIAVILLMITLIGIPLAAAGIFFLIGLFWLASLASPVVLGSAVYKRIKKQENYTVSWLTILLGAGILFVLSLIPILGGLICFFVWVVVLGSLSSALWNGVKHFRK